MARPRKQHVVIVNDSRKVRGTFFERAHWVTHFTARFLGGTKIMRTNKATPTAGNENFLIRWRLAVISEVGPASSTTRLVLLVLACHMRMDGGSCFPSTRTIAQECALSERCVCDHLEMARNQGWIKSRKRGKRAGQAWAGNEYQATLPALTKLKGTELRSAPSAKEAEPHAMGAEPEDIKALNAIQPNSSSNSSKNSGKDRACNPAPPGAIDDCWGALGVEPRAKKDSHGNG
jgi:Helix-turn-helix domain